MRRACPAVVSRAIGPTIATRWSRSCGTGPGSRGEIFYYYDDRLTAVRQGPWKLHLETIESASGESKSRVPEHPLLFNLAHDPSERFDVADRHPDVVERLMGLIKAHRASVTRGKPQR